MASKTGASMAEALFIVPAAQTRVTNVSFRRALDARTAAILAAPASDWRRPASPTARPDGNALPMITDRDRGGAQ